MKIEAGCQAIIIKSERGNEGSTVSVVKFIGEWMEHNDWWRINIGGDKMFVAREKHLMRIDGFKPEVLCGEKQLIGV